MTQLTYLRVTHLIFVGRGGLKLNKKSTRPLKKKIAPITIIKTKSACT